MAISFLQLSGFLLLEALHDLGGGSQADKDGIGQVSSTTTYSSAIRIVVCSLRAVHSVHDLGGGSQADKDSIGHVSSSTGRPYVIVGKALEHERRSYSVRDHRSTSDTGS